MSLYRTWRPKSFADLVGQDAVVRTLTAAIEGGKLAHAYLFSGPRGSGKTSAAKILARCIECVKGPTATPDNTCENCRAIFSGTALDVLEIDAASNRGIDEIRALRDAVKFAPSSMRMKVYIIDEAHMLTKEGANAFLKTLEEPPPHAVFVLATTEPEKLPATILSRCQRYAFSRIAVPVMIARMAEIAAAEGIAIDEAALSAIAYRADGGLRDALTMLEQAAAFAGTETVSLATIERAFGATGREFALAIVDALIAADAAAGLRTVERAADAGADIAVLLRSVVGALRNLLVAQVDPSLLERDLAPEDARDAAVRSQGIAAANVGRALRIFSDAATVARTAGSARLELETALLRYLLSPEEPGIEALAARVDALERRGSAPPRAPAPTPAPPRREPQRTAAPAPTPAPARSEPARREPAAPGSISLLKMRAAWQSVRAKAESEHPPLRGPLSGARVEEVEGSTLVLLARNQVDESLLRERIGLLEAAVADVLGAAFKVSVRVEAGSRSKGPPPSDAATQRAPAAEDAEDPEALFQYAHERISQP